jgi:hypothetical protein
VNENVILNQVKNPASSPPLRMTASFSRENLMKHKLHILFAALALLLLGSASALAAPIPGASSSPAPSDAAAGLNTTFKINIVFIGYSEEDIDIPTLEAQLPTTYDPIVRYPAFYGIDLPVNVHGDYEYNYLFANSAFEDAFFGYLGSIGTDGPLTDYQAAYNSQEHRSLTIESPNVLYVDAPSTERWLTEHGRSDLGLDLANYTIFFVNWYGRPDFQFHVYTKTDNADPDTGYNFGVARQSRKIIAWGGSFGRTWFYDLSAGPEAWTNNWNVDDADLDGNGQMDYRMPPVWEYGNMSAYRPFDDLSGDLGKVARYVAIDLLFTSSPLYDPLVSEPFPGRGKRVYINLFEDDPHSNGLDWFNKQYILRTMRNFEPQYNWLVTIKDQALKGTPMRRAFRIWAGIRDANDCWNAYGTPFAELFCHVDQNRNLYLPPIKPLKRYIGGVFAFNTTDERLGEGAGLLGYADDDWISGTPTYVFEFDTPTYRAVGYGFSTTTTHEFGHHIGMSHPHDGYDSTSGLDYGPGDDFYYAWSGDESHTIMSYIDLAFQFGWFDRDNMNRFLTGRYITRVAQITAQLNQTETSREVGGLVEDANARVSDARGAFGRMDYQRSAEQARAAFERVYRAAQLAGLSVPLATPLPAGGRMDREKLVDPIHPHRNK